MDLLGRLGGDGLDVHAALGTGHQRDALRAAVDDHADVEFLFDVRAFLHQQPAHLLPARAGLVRDQLHAEDLGRALLHLVERLRDLDAAALAAAAGVDLRLDDPHLAAERLRGLDGLVDGKRRNAARNGHAEPAEDLLALILVNLHCCSRLKLPEFTAG